MPEIFETFVIFYAVVFQSFEINIFFKKTDVLGAFEKA